MKIVAGILGVVLLICVFVGIGIATDLGGLAYKGATSGFRGSMNAEESIESEPNRIANYEKFFQLCNGVKQLDSKIANADNGSTEQKGLMNRRAEVASQYNAMAASDYTSARFKDSKLPSEISTDYQAGRTTNCN